MSDRFGKSNTGAVTDDNYYNAVAESVDRLWRRVRGDVDGGDGGGGGDRVARALRRAERHSIRSIRDARRMS